MVDSERPFKMTNCDDRDWSSLPADILSCISSCLFFADYNSFGKVCTSWKSSQLHLSQMPFLFLRKQIFSVKPYCKLLNITNNHADKIYMPKLASKVCVGSQYGWLILVDNRLSIISLYNPFSHQEMMLPFHGHIVRWFRPIEAPPFSKADIICKWFSFKKVVLSCDPASSTEDFLSAAALFDTGEFIYKQNVDYRWKFLSSDDWHHLHDITSWRGMFAGVTRNGDVYKLDLDVPEPKLQCIGKGLADYYTASRYSVYLVNLNDNLLQVWWLNDSRTQRSVTVKIMQLDLGRLAWVPVDELCGHSLFLGASHSFSLSSQHIPGLKDNLVYFFHDTELKWIDALNNWSYRTNGKPDVGVFDMTNGTYEICSFPNTPLTFSTSAFWYAPPQA